MAYEESNNNGMVMPVGPIGGYGNNGGLFGLGGDNGLWIIVLFLLFGGGMWGMNGMGGMGGMYGLYPWLNNSQHISDGFRDQQTFTGITSIRDSVGNLSTQMCNGFSQAEIAANGRQMADMQQNFALQREIAGVDASIAREACATRANSTQNTQSILNVITGGIQSIKDQLCQDKIDAKDDIIAQLRQENLYARGQASQVEQTARILAGQAAEIDGVYNRLKNCPVGAVPVFGNQPIFSCAQNVAGSCNGCNNGFGFVA